jgi:hypothetical protein
MWRRVDLVWSDVSEERISSIFRVYATTQETSFFIVTAVKI